MAHVIKTTFLLRRGPAQRWIDVNPVLAQGEPGFEYDTNKLKIGDGQRRWTELPYIATGDVEVTQLEEIVTVQEFKDLPVQGDMNKLYRVISTKLLYQWNSNKYESLGGEGSFDPSTISLINGGNANG